MLTTARLLVSMEVSDRPDLIFCAFNGEEQFYIGSQAFVESFKEIYESPYNINYDCVGMVNGGAYMMGAGEEDTAYELIRSMSQFLESGGILLNDYNNQSIRSDHVSFVKAGIPGVCLSMINVPSVIHSPNDTTDQVDAAEVAGLAAAVADYLDQSRMAGSE